DFWLTNSLTTESALKVAGRNTSPIRRIGTSSLSPWTSMRIRIRHSISQTTRRRECHNGEMLSASINFENCRGRERKPRYDDCGLRSSQSNEPFQSLRFQDLAEQSDGRLRKRGDAVVKCPPLRVRLCLAG